MPTPPPSDVIALRDETPGEVESRAELAVHLASGTLSDLVVEGLDLDGGRPVDLTDVDVTDALFVGCRFASAEVAADLVRRGALVVPAFTGMPYRTHPGRLYTPDDLAAGFAHGGFAGMYDTLVYRHFRAAGGAQPGVREALVQRLHDNGIDNALASAVYSWTRARGEAAAVGVMGGHAVRRGSAAYRMAAELSRGLARADRLVVTGGGPGVMEAANLGAYLAERPDGDLTAAIATLASAPDFRDHDRYTAAALAARERFPATADTTPLGWARRGGLSIPTWLYGHEPANLFAGRIAKYFSNAIREDTILRLSRGGIVFAPGGAGTVQEVFQAATKTFYATDGVSGPYIFLDREYWTRRVPIRDLLVPLLAASPAGDSSALIHLTDDVAEALALLQAGPPAASDAR
ncbi:MAG: hypothetical protein QOE03_1581 [Micromonosporaceae bacterium]|nr:hypothetical protein [Micromonosporaceae bacterium]